METENPNNARDKPGQGKNIRPLLLVIILLLLVIIWLLIKPPVPALPRPPISGSSPRPERVEKERLITGVVIAYKSNPHMDVNALVLKTKTEGLMTIDFRPHTAKAVTKIGVAGESVTVKYDIHPNDEIVGYQLKAIRNDKTGVDQILNDLPPPPDVPSHQTSNFELDHPLLITDQYGGIVALRKKDLLFHFKPGLVDDIAPLIKTNTRFSLIAVRRPDNQGFININHDKVYIVLSITMDNKTFLVR